VRAVIAAVAAVLLVAASPAAALNDGNWKHWRDLAGHQCPSHHVDWVGDGEWLRLTVGFESTLTRAQRHRLGSLVASNSGPCAGEVAGFSCEMAVSLNAYDRLGLMGRFTKYTCKTVKCEDAAICSRMPPEVD